MKWLAAFLALATCALAGAQTEVPHPKEVNIWVARDVAPGPAISLQINTQNVTTVHISAYKIDGMKWLSQDVFTPADRRPRPTAGPIFSWEQSVVTPDQTTDPRQTNHFYERRVNLPKLKPGVYYLLVKGGAEDKWAVVNVTNLAIIIKRSARRLLAWVTDAKTGAVLPGAAVSVFSDKGAMRTSAKTGADGACLLPLSRGEDAVVVSRGPDIAGVLAVGTNADGELVAHCQTDRPIYRPGQTMAYKVILRRRKGQGYTSVANEKCQVEVRDPKDNPLEIKTIESNGIGTISGKVEIPSEGMLGAYTLKITVGKQETFHTFSVAEYRKPEFKAEAKPGQKHYLSGDELTFDVDATYFFGAPVPQSTVRYQIRSSPMGWYTDPSDQWFYSGDGNLYPSDTYRRDPFVAEGEAFTDNNGHVSIKVKSKDLPDANYSFSATVIDRSNRQVQAATSVPVFASELRIHLSSELTYATLGGLVPVQVQVVDVEGKSQPATVALQVTHEVWNDKKQVYEEKTLAKSIAKVPASGKLKVTLPANAEGDLFIKAQTKDHTGRVTSAIFEMYVAGLGVKEGRRIEQPTASIRLDKRSYLPGQPAKAFILTNHPKRPVLAVLEGGDIWAYKVSTENKAGFFWNFTPQVRLSPNAFVTAAQWVSGRQVMANTIVPVPDLSRSLKLSVEADKATYRPGDEAHYRIKVLDNAGHPAPGEVSLAVIDEAIYEVSPDNTLDLFTQYWGQRGNTVETTVSAPEELSGGAYQRVDTVAPVRRRFEDTAYWNPIIEPGADGVADISFEVPGNLTTWRATARAITSDTKVGTAVTKVLANRPAMLRLATPRQFVTGDRLTLIGTIDNRTDQSHTFDVRLVAQGIALESPAKQTIVVAAKSEATVEWNLHAANLPDSGDVMLTAELVPTDVSGQEQKDLADAIELRVPVSPFGIPERILASGLLGESAEADFNLPSARIEPASSLQLQIWSGFGAVLHSVASDLFSYPRYGTISATSQLTAAVAVGKKPDEVEVRESLALLSRTESPQGWGWWQGAHPDPIITAETLIALAEAKRGGLRVFDNLMKGAQGSAERLYRDTNLWEHRAILAAALSLSGADKGPDYMEECLTRGTHLSPYALLLEAEALGHAGKTEKANQLVDEVLKNAAIGPQQSFIPVGEGTGWRHSSFDATAEAVRVLTLLKRDNALQSKFAAWLVDEEHSRWMSESASAGLVRALASYVAIHPDKKGLGNLKVQINGKGLDVPEPKFGTVTVKVPRSLLASRNHISIKSYRTGEAIYDLSAKVFIPARDENSRGIRVLRRFEVQNAAGIWEELKGPIKPGEPIRCTTIAWGDDLSDALKVTQPIPAGFEYIDGTDPAWGRVEVRDAAVITYLENSGAPQIFRYYLRSESTGKLNSIPVTAEYLMRPQTRGNSSAQVIEVTGGK